MEAPVAEAEVSGEAHLAHEKIKVQRPASVSRASSYLLF